MADITISADDIASALTKRLEGSTPALEANQVGQAIEVGDGIARVSGLPGVAVNELLEFEGGVLGLALNLDEESIGAVVLGEVGDGIARVSGLPGVAVNELLEFEGGVLGLALNLDEESIGAVVLGEVD